KLPATGGSRSQESTSRLGGEPLKVEAFSSRPGSEVSGSPVASPTTPVKLELPVKLLRLDTPMQVKGYEPDERMSPNELILSPVSDSMYDIIPERSRSVPDVWSPLVGGWRPWVATKHDLAICPSNASGHPEEPDILGESFASFCQMPLDEEKGGGSSLHGTG
ncbi:unnamed protein product, partial [Polarella glacialis]